MTCRLDRPPKSERVSISLASGSTSRTSSSQAETSGMSPSLLPSLLQLSPWAEATGRALGNECVFNGFGNAAGVVVVVPQRSQDSGRVHVLHLLVVLKGIAVDVG